MNHMTNTTTPTTTTPVAGTPTLSVAVDTHLKAYCEPDPATRAELLAAVWAPTGALFDPPFEGEGLDAIAAMTDVVLTALCRSHVPPDHRHRRPSHVRPLRLGARRSGRHRGRHRNRHRRGRRARPADRIVGFFGAAPERRRSADGTRWPDQATGYPAMRDGGVRQRDERRGEQDDPGEPTREGGGDAGEEECARHEQRRLRCSRRRAAWPRRPAPTAAASSSYSIGLGEEVVEILLVLDEVRRRLTRFVDDRLPLVEDRQETGRTMVSRRNVWRGTFARPPLRRTAWPTAAS